ncbi:unnamed protein product [Ectocarpus sp. CCAP 1310/34]|nr:unnamed protein product [Ectocarpus sp. CCAP 1310/34]
MVVRAASRRALVKSFANSAAVVVRSSSRVSRLRRNRFVTAHRAGSNCNSRRLNGFCFGLVRTARLWASLPPRLTVATTIFWSESALTGRTGWGMTTTLDTRP